MDRYIDIQIYRHILQIARILERYIDRQLKEQIGGPRHVQVAAYRYIHGQIDRWMPKQKYQCVQRQIYREIDRWKVDTQISGYIDRQIDGQIDRQIDSQRDRQIDRQIHRYIN